MRYIVLLALLGCSTSPTASLSMSPAAPGDMSGALTVFAAASLTEAFNELGAAFEAEHPDVSIVFNFNGSQRLRTQLEHGAQADIFASADWSQMEAVVASGLVRGQPINFAGNRLAVIVSLKSEFLDADAPLSETDGLAYLAKPGVKVVLALPEAPVGAYSLRAIQRIQADPRFGPQYAERVEANVVSRETNVRNVAQKVALGEADAGIVYQTDATASYVAGRVRAAPIPEEVNVVAGYPLVALRGSGQASLAGAFIDFILSDQGQAILRSYGFGAPGDKSGILPGPFRFSPRGAAAPLARSG